MRFTQGLAFVLGRNENVGDAGGRDAPCARMAVEWGVGGSYAQMLDYALSLKRNGSAALCED